FAVQLLPDLLGRPAEADEVSGASTALGNGVPAPQVVRGIEDGVEFRTQLVDRLYRTLLRRAPDGPGLAFWVQELNLGATAGQAEAGVLGSTEYFIDFGQGTNLGFVRSVYADVLHRGLDPMAQKWVSD